jgi:hypothetical protein
MYYGGADRGVILNLNIINPVHYRYAESIEKPLGWKEITSNL